MTTEELRKYFADKGVSQQEVGRFIDVDSRTVRSWFAGKYPWPHLLTLAINADIFGVEAQPDERIKNKLVLRSSHD